MTGELKGFVAEKDAYLHDVEIGETTPLLALMIETTGASPGFLFGGA